MKKKNIGEIAFITAGVLTEAFTVLHIAGKKSKEKNQDGIDDDNQYLKNTDDGKYKPVVHHQLSGYERIWKPVIDKTLSFAGLVVLAPIYGVLSLAILIDDPGPVLFTQKRVGKDKHFFKLHKFRSMKMSTPHDVPTHMLDNPEQYITRVGRFLRKTSLDELPQIWDIFIGNMSIIGPRPALWNQDDLIEERDKYGAYNVFPGLTGWAQINGRDELEISEKAKLDGDYVDKIVKGGMKALLFDIKCFFGTIISVANENGVVEGGTGKLKKKNGFRLDTAGVDRLSIQGEDKYQIIDQFEQPKEYNTKDKSDKKNFKKILVICQYYYPEPFRVNDLCEEMARRGHEILVVTGEPNYPEGKIYPGYENHAHSDEIINGVKIHRCPIIPRSTGAIRRFANYYSYPHEATKYVLSDSCKGFDVIFVNQLSPVMMAKPAIAYREKYGTPIVMYCLDIWPESLVAGGITRSSVVYKYYNRVSKKIYCQMDKILVTSRMFTGYLYKKFGIKNFEYLPQYAEGLFNVLPYKHTETYDFIFAGNIGSVQSVNTIVEAAKRLREKKNIRFHIIGAGSDWERIKELAKGLNNICFYGRRKLEEMPGFYSMADAMLVTLKADPVLSLTLPGKVQSYMAVGKPIIGAINGETAEIIKEAECGFCGRAEDVDALVVNIKLFIESNDKEKMGKNAKEFYERQFRRDNFMDKMERHLTGVVSK